MAELEVNAGVLDGLERLLELHELPLRVRLVPAVRHGEMREHAFDFNIRQGLDLGGQSADFFRTDADAAHARLDLEVYLSHLVLAHGLAGDCLRERQLADDLRHIVIDDVARLVRQHKAQEEDWRREARFAQLNGLAKRRDREIRGPGLHSHTRDSHGTMPVGISLDDRTELRAAANILFDFLIIMSQSAQVNLRPSRTIRHEKLPFSLTLHSLISLLHALEKSSTDSFFHAHSHHICPWTSSGPVGQLLRTRRRLSAQSKSCPLLKEHTKRPPPKRRSFICN